MTKCEKPESPRRYLATTSSDHTVKIWNIQDFSLARVLKGTNFDISSVLIL